MLYFVEFQIEYVGFTQEELLAVWLQEAEAGMRGLERGTTKQLYKIVGERKAILVVDLDSEVLDKVLLQLPLMKLLGNQIDLKVTALRPYEKFATDVNKLIQKEEQHDVIDTVKRDGLFFWLEFNVEYKGMDLMELLRIWSEEANAALGKKREGIIVDIWKCVGMRRFHCIVCVDSPDDLDEITFTLPIMKQIGNNINVLVKSLRKYESLFADLKKWCDKD